MSDSNIVKFMCKVLKCFDKTPQEKTIFCPSGSHAALEIIYTMSKFQFLRLETTEGYRA